LQHVRQFELAVQQIYSNLKSNGVFWNYSLAVQPHIRLIKRFIGGGYVMAGVTPQGIWLERGSIKQAQWLAELFKSSVSVRYSEFIFSPEIGYTSPGLPANKLLGPLDAHLSGRQWMPHWLARQISYHVRKSN
jgi:hypothetical protein